MRRPNNIGVLILLQNNFIMGIKAMNTSKIRGIIVKEVMYSEADKILTVVAKDYGKLTITARGARKSTKKFINKTNVFTYGDFYINSGKRFNTLTDVELIHSFYSISTDLLKLAFGYYFLELMEKITFENQPCNNTLYLLLKTLMTLEKSNLPPKLICPIFELKLIQFSGYMPHTSHCCYCEEPISGDCFFCADGVVCRNCAGKTVSAIPINGTILYAVEYILSNDTNRLYTFAIKSDMLPLFNKVTHMLLCFHLNLNLKTYDFTKKIDL